MATDNALKVEMLVMYKECMHNHAASSRGFLLDGCGLFESPSGTTTGSREAMLCAVCGCHRNFHQRVVVEIPQHHRSSSIRHQQQQQLQPRTPTNNNSPLCTPTNHNSPPRTPTNHNSLPRTTTTTVVAEAAAEAP
ncbi:hypothetical protein ABFX02_02G071800 [Erythranthe guttata]